MPNSLLWIGLVAVWLFVLVPMLVTKRPRIRQTTDAALATRVLHRGGAERLLQRGPTGHRSDPNWHPADDPRRFARTGETRRYRYRAEDRMDTHIDDGSMFDEDAVFDEPHGRDNGESVREFVPHRRGRGGFDPEADALASAARYEFRQRAVLGLMFASIMTAALALIMSSTMWWVCAVSVLSLAGYLTYLRRQVRLEKEIRRRRMARLGRSRGASPDDEELRGIPARLRRPGGVVLEVDDDDPEFEHLDHFEEQPVACEIRSASGL